MTALSSSAPLDAWRRHAWAWPAVTATMLAAATVISIFSDSDRSLPLVLTLVVAFATWQLAWRPWYGRLMGADAPAVVWGLGTVGLWLALALADPAFHLLLFVLFALLFSATNLRVAAGLAVALSTAIGISSVPSSPTASEIGVAVVVAVVGSTLAIAMASWIHGIIAQSGQRAELIAQLEATRNELAEAERTAGALAERGRLAAEIHDTLAQGFTSIALLLEAVRPALDQSTTGDAAALRRLDLALDTARTNLAEARHLVADLGPAPLDGSTLPDAVRRAAEQFAVVSGAVVDVRVEGEPRRLPADHEVTLLRIAQESLTNVRRHAAADAVTVALRYEPDGAVGLDVRDDGHGFDTDQPADGFGLRGMAGRVEPLGGTFAVASTPGAGTTVAVHLP